MADEPNRRCVEGQWQVYQYRKMLNEMGVMSRLITHECQVLTESLRTVLAKDIVIEALIKALVKIKPHPTSARGKRSRSSRPGESIDEARSFTRKCVTSGNTP